MISDGPKKIFLKRNDIYIKKKYIEFEKLKGLFLEFWKTLGAVAYPLLYLGPPLHRMNWVWVESSYLIVNWFATS